MSGAAAHDVPSSQSGSGANAGCAGAFASVVPDGSSGVADDPGLDGVDDEEEEEGDGEEDDAGDGEAVEQAATRPMDTRNVIERTTSA